MKALVYKSTGSWYIIKNEAGEFFNARLKGKFKIGGITSTNPVAVGDWVEADKEDIAEESVVIHKIYPRQNYITRQSPHNKHLHHIIAANLDQSILLATLKEPRTSTGFIKSDLYKEKELSRFEELKGVYEKLGYRVLLMSVNANEGIQEILGLLKSKTTLISGHSGVGKSSFINAIFPEKRLKTKEVSTWSGLKAG